MNYVFVHGWGFSNDIWTSLKCHLPQGEYLDIDLGFFWDPRNDDNVNIFDDAVLIGHSLGTLWLLKHMPKSPKALISIGGFDCFYRHVPMRQITTMKRQLARDPVGLLQSFWRNCGLSQLDLYPLDDLNIQRLQDGLDWLMTWDAQSELQALETPILALAGRNDLIVSEQMSQEAWGDYDLRWSDIQGHMLPLDDAQWCAAQIKDFLKSENLE